MNEARLYRQTFKDYFDTIPTKKYNAIRGLGALVRRRLWFLEEKIFLFKNYITWRIL